MGKPIILDEWPFTEGFLPPVAWGREEHVDQILSCLASIKQGVTPSSVYVYGSPGAGKTTTVKSILKAHFPDMSVYINCWNNRTSHKIMEQVLKQMDSGSRKFVHGRESTSELIREFERLRKRVIICLDEADQLKKRDVLYVFARNSCPLILISNQSYSPTRIDERIKSSLHIKEIEFRPYRTEHITQILKDRISAGINPNAITENLVSEIANCCSGDARAGIQILKNSALYAESKGLHTITMDEIRSAAGCARKYKKSYLLAKLNEHQKVIYEILKQSKSMDSGSLFNEYRKTVNETVTDRSYRNYMARMVELGLVREMGSSRWKRYEIII